MPVQLYDCLLIYVWRRLFSRYARFLMPVCLSLGHDAIHWTQEGKADADPYSDVAY